MRQCPRKPGKAHEKHSARPFGLSRRDRRAYNPYLTGDPNLTAHFRASARNATHIPLTHGHDDHIGDTPRTGAEIIANFNLSVWLQARGAQKINLGNTGGKRSRHREERSDAATQGPRATPGMLRCARNDGGEARDFLFRRLARSRQPIKNFMQPTRLLSRAREPAKQYLVVEHQLLVSVERNFAPKPFP